MSKLLWLILLVMLFGMIYPLRADDTTSLLERFGVYPCPDSEFTCIRLTVPLDHFAPPPSETIEVVFAVLPASGERKGMFVTATGGPGVSGLAVADSYTATFAPSILEHFDIVFFDQRGIAASGGISCPTAAATYYQTEADPLTDDGEAALIASAETFAQGCVAEIGTSETLQFYGTQQAIEDLELFRQQAGDEQFWLYGESYGTQFAQTYAAKYGEHLAGLILDGTVDLTLTGTEFYQQQAQAFHDVLVATLNACTDDPDCSADVVGGDALAFYDSLAAKLREEPITFSFPLASGGSAERTFELPDLEAAAAGYMYSEGSRMMFQRALAAASQGDFVLLARIAYGELGLDPDTLEITADPTFSDAVFYAVDCADYSYFSGSPAERAQAYVDAGDTVESEISRLSSIFYGDLPCAFWPGTPAEARPAPLEAKGVSTLVLGATLDPATPVSNGERVYSHLDEGFLVTMEGGAHVIYGRGDACTDDLVTAFLVDDVMPEQRETICEGEVASPYVPLAPKDGQDYQSPLEALDSAYNEIYYLPEYYYWDLNSLQIIGCPYGGVLAYGPAAAGDQFKLINCAFSAGFIMTGTGEYAADSSIFTLDVTVSGYANGKLTYVSDDVGSSVSGEYNGEIIDLAEEF